MVTTFLFITFIKLLAEFNHVYLRIVAELKIHFLPDENYCFRYERLSNECNG